MDNINAEATIIALETIFPLASPIYPRSMFDAGAIDKRYNE